MRKIVLVLFLLTALISTAAAAKGWSHWLIISSASQHDQLTEGGNVVVMFAAPDCAGCDEAKQHWERVGIPGGWVFLYWEDQNTDYRRVLNSQRALFARRSDIKPPIIIARTADRQAVFIGAEECTTRPVVTESRPQRSRRSTLTEWLRDQTP